MGKFIDAQQGIILLKKAKGRLEDKDIDLIIETYDLNEEQTDDFIVWLNDNALMQEEVSDDTGEYGGYYLTDISQYPVLTRQQEYDLAVRAHEGDEKAKDTLIKSNLRLVVSIARKYAGGQLSFNDLVQEGNIGLMKAVDKYDPARNIRFATYGSYWIRKHISEAIALNHMIHLPANIHLQIQQLNRTAKQLEQKLERMPTDLEIAEAHGITLEKLNELRTYQYDAISFNKPVGDETDDELIDRQPSGESSDDVLQQEIGELLASMDVRDAEIIRLRYGLQGRERRTLQQIGEMYGVSKERIRQLEARATSLLRKLHEGGER